MFSQRQGQTWSFDLLIAVVLFVIIVSVFYAFLAQDSSEDSTDELQTGAKTIGYNLNCDLSSSQHCVIKNNKIDTDQLQELWDTYDTVGYQELQKKLNIQGDFCIYFKDKQDYLVPIELETETISGIGNPTFKINENINCSQVLQNY
ncbi:MAG: hypothetical protein ACOCQQ_01680 [Candidatus Nanoarchaeia archaeon]